MQLGVPKVFDAERLKILRSSQWPAAVSSRSRSIELNAGFGIIGTFDVIRCLTSLCEEFRVRFSGLPPCLHAVGPVSQMKFLVLSEHFCTLTSFHVCQACLKGARVGFFCKWAVTLVWT